MRNLKRQVGQLAKQAEQPTNIFSSDTIPSPREECKVVQLRRGKTVGEDTKNITREATKLREEDKRDHKNDKETQTSKKGKEIMKPQSEKKNGGVKPYVPKLPYPQSLHKEMSDQQFPKFLEIFRKFEINIPLAEALEQMPFINLMPLSMMRRLSIEEVKPTRMSLQLVDRSLVIPNGVVENLLVKVGKFIFPANFVILNLDEEESDSIILGRPFLTTARAIIDVEKREITLRAHDEQIILNVFKEMQHPAKKKGCMRIEEEDLNWKEKPQESLINSPLVQKTGIEEK
ncbi:uncharacterized protein LOC130980893 [Arachis stenosperma]|uniref:uncharacterized protein LOC130980893 n=1 Tax=Arachis stenosperma TaxID=217475 RepID=UPI0025AC8E78|nr:uncharacterized protein LOC130980893 [Arachis stenosperma]